MLHSPEREAKHSKRGLNATEGPQTSMKPCQQVCAQVQRITIFGPSGKGDNSLKLSLYLKLIKYCSNIILQGHPAECTPGVSLAVKMVDRSYARTDEFVVDRRPEYG